MKALKLIGAVIGSLAFTAFAVAGDAETSAGVARGPLVGGNAATATAHYEGKLGFARTDTNSGRVTTARGVAVGVDKNGLTLSVSNAVAAKFGPAVAATFNISIGRDGDVSKSTGVSVARGPLGKEASAGGSATTNRRDAGGSAWASGNAPLGRVIAETRSRSR
jgi:hypothetical protein